LVINNLTKFFKDSKNRISAAITLKEVLGILCKTCARRKVALVCTSDAHPTLAGGNPANKLTYTAASGHKTLAVYTIKGDKTFILEYITGQEATYSTYLP